MYELAKENYLTKTKKINGIVLLEKTNVNEILLYVQPVIILSRSSEFIKSWKIPINLMDVIIIMIQL